MNALEYDMIAILTYELNFQRTSNFITQIINTLEYMVTESALAIQNPK